MNMYIENLQTPHPKASVHVDGLPQESLIEAADIQAAREYIDGASPVTRTQAVLEVANHLSGVVHHTLRWDGDAWPVINDTQEALRDEQASIPDNQIVNCIGYGLVTDELFKAVGIKERTILYFNGHFMNGIVTGDSTGPRLHMFDPDNIIVSGQDITSALIGSPEPSRQSASENALMTQLTKDTEREGRGAARLSTEIIIRNAGLDFVKLEEEGSYPWLQHAKNQTPNTSTNSNLQEKPEFKRLQRYTTFMSMYPAQLGRRIMLAYSLFASNSIDGDMDHALIGVQAMGSLQPELDGRKNHQYIKGLIGRLAAEERTYEAMEAIQSYCSGFAISKDPRLKGLAGSLYASVSRTTNDEAARGVAILAYLEAMEASRHESETFKGKIQKLLGEQGVALTYTLA